MMVDVFDTVLQNYGNVYGLSGSNMLMIIAVMLSIGVAITLAYTTKNKNMGLAGFFITLAFTAFMGWINWLYLAIPLILIAATFFYLRERGEP